MAKYKIIPSSRTIVHSPISIGHKAEKGVEAIEFDLTAWVETYGSGTATIIMRRWGDAIPYPIALEIDENNKATWTLSDIDTAKAGMAYAQLSYIVGDEVVKKSDIYTFRVMDSLTGEGEPPEAYESWLEHLQHLAAEAMAEVLDIEGIVTDKTLTVDGGIADGKATGDALSALEDQFGEETDKLKADLDNVTELVADVNTHQETAIETTTPTWAQGYIAPDGSVGSGTTLYYCTPINVSEGDVIQPKRGDGGLIASAYYLTAYYDNSAVSALGGNNVSMPYTVPSGVDQIVLTIASVYMGYGNPKIKHTYTVTVQTLVRKFVSLGGNGEVVAQNIDGMEEIGIGASNNLFSTATLIESGKYIAGINGSGKVYFYTNESYDTYIIPVDGKSIYTFTDVRFGCVVSDLEYTAVGSILSNVKQINSSGGSYILFSFAPSTYPIETFIITKPVTYYKIPQNWILGASKKHTDSESGAIASGGTLGIIGRTALKDGETISFKGFFETFSGFSLNFVATDITNFITVTASTITIKSTSIVPTAVNHGLTIRNYVSLDCQFFSGKLKVTLYSNDDSYTTTVDWFQLNGQVTQPQIVSDGTVFSSATLSIAYDAVKRDVWFFGDSYIGVIDPARWPYYLAENGFIQNILLNGSSGGSSGGTIISFVTLLKYGTPKFAVFGTGMNDGSDSSSAPPTGYVTRRTEFLKLCEGNEIEPIFCTIPTVPSINNEQKNAWVRSSGYRYIDFAKAVGADGTGAWFDGMLSSDNVHPSAKGAKALYTQVLVDLPEVAVS